MPRLSLLQTGMRGEGTYFANEPSAAHVLAVNKEEYLSKEQEIADDLDSEWQRKGATMGDKSARAEFGLTQEEVVRAIRAGKLHCREGSMYVNPWLRLRRRRG